MSATDVPSPQPGEEKSTNLRMYLRILGYLRPYYRSIILVIIFNFCFVIFNTLSYWMIAPVITTLFDDSPRTEQVGQVEETEEVSSLNLNAWLKSQLNDFFPRGDRVETLKFLCLLIFFAFLFKNTFAFLEFYWVSFVEQKVIKDLREELYQHVIHQPLAFFTHQQTGNLISNITNDINAINVAVNRSFTKVIRDPFLIIIFLTLLFSISWQLTLMAMIVFPVTIIILQHIGRSLKRKSHRVQERISEITTILQEAISGIKVVKAFAMESYEDEKFRKGTRAHFKAVLRQVRLNRLSGPLSETVGVGMMVCVLWFGGHLVLQGQLLSSEDFIRFITLLFAITEPVKSLGMLNNNIQIALASGQRVFDILDTPSTITDHPNPVTNQAFEKTLRYESVGFHYGSESDPVLRDISFSIQKNEKIAFVGSSGAGKTTLVNLLPRFYDTTSGSILIDDKDIREIKLTTLREMMGIVTQEVILFNDTIANNIAYGLDEYSEEKVINAARLANAHDFISEFPNGYKTVVGERGVRLSGGQRQRISIARAILKNPPILIFDEATSSLDSESEHLIQEAIENLMRDRTVLMIAHRLSSIIKSDKLIVLEDGRISDIGTHTELLERSERYKQLYELQFAVQ